MFLEDEGYVVSNTNFKVIKDLYADYRRFCLEDGVPPVKIQNFITRLKSYEVVVEKKNVGNVAFLVKDKKTL